MCCFFSHTADPKGFPRVRPSSRRALSHLCDMEATLAVSVTSHPRCPERGTVTNVTGPGEGEKPKPLKTHVAQSQVCACLVLTHHPPFPLNTWGCLCELLYFLILLTFTPWGEMQKDSNVLCKIIRLSDIVTSVIRKPHCCSVYDLAANTCSFIECAK